MALSKILTGTTAIALIGLVWSCSQSPSSSSPTPSVVETTTASESPVAQAPEAAETPVARVPVTSESPIAQAPSLDCTNAQTQAEMNACAAQDAKIADQKLNEVYQQLRAAIANDAQKQRLVTAQLAWIAFRDKDCEYSQRRYDGGSIMPMIYSSCIAERSEQRTKELQAYIDEIR
jgi:uncharacterized protein YecT (DUF1311 family)